MSTGHRSARLPAPAGPRRARVRTGRRFCLTAGGIDGNEQLTAITGVTLIVLLAIIGVTILRIHQLISVHLFVGLMLLGPVVLKMASTGYRFARYYTGNRVYREKGPPPPALRLIAPGVVVTTLAVFASGVVVMFEAPAHRGVLVLLHKASFIIWLGVTGLHVLGHLPGLWTSLRGAASVPGDAGVPGSPGRWLALAGALVAGLVLAIVLIPRYSAWTAPGAFPHHLGDH
jgi:hypothetical protein